VIGKMIDHLVIVHPITTIHTEYIPAGLHSGPIEMPIIIAIHLMPATFLEIVDQNRFIQVRAEANFQFIVSLGTTTGTTAAICATI